MLLKHLSSVNSFWWRPHDSTLHFDKIIWHYTSPAPVWRASAGGRRIVQAVAPYIVSTRSMYPSPPQAAPAAEYGNLRSLSNTPKALFVFVCDLALHGNARFCAHFFHARCLVREILYSRAIHSIVVSLVSGRIPFQEFRRNRASRMHIWYRVRKALSWGNLLFEMGAYVQRHYRERSFLSARCPGT